MEKITYVTQAFVPEKQKYLNYIDKIWENKILTNQGPLLQEFEIRLKNFLNLKNIQFLTNGTLPLQLAIRSLGIEDSEIITTPFSYVATVSSILWERCEPVFVDIESENFSIDVDKIEKAITSKTKAIMAVHCFGFPCDVDKLQKIADKNNLKLIYDGAHAFGCKINGKSLLSFGDISTCSFHSTKLFHTIEGGAIICNNDALNKKIDLMKRFGHNHDEHIILGINAKASEFQSAMGLCNLDEIYKIIQNRRNTYEFYKKNLDSNLKIPLLKDNLEYNYGYFPVIFENEAQLIRIFQELNKENIFPRKYFYPSLNKLAYLKSFYSCPISEDISSRIACLPLYFGIEKDVILKICQIINKNL
jgi:dTDP-4-amino-4,6-dideoxygalactose transaminase